MTLKTKFGTARIENGYYRISSRKEGNRHKPLHRLIYESVWGKIPEGYVIHHIDGDKTNNCILNLLMLSNEHHTSLHNKGKTLTEEHKKKIGRNQFRSNNPMYGKHHTYEHNLKVSKKMGSTGYYRVYKHNNPKCTQGFVWRYQYYENGKRKSFTSVDIDTLKEKVLTKGLPWIKLA